MILIAERNQRVDMGWWWWWWCIEIERSGFGEDEDIGSVAFFFLLCFSG